MIPVSPQPLKSTSQPSVPQSPEKEKLPSLLQQERTFTEKERARQILADMNAGRITWDDNLRAWAEKVLRGTPSPEELMKQQAESYYGEIMQNLDKLAGLYPEHKQKWEQTVRNLYSSQLADKVKKEKNVYLAWRKTTLRENN